MLISPAYAQGAAGGGDFIFSLLPLVLIFVVFYFLLIRPQQKKLKTHKEMLSNIRRGDRVVTNGGIIGTVVRVTDDNELSLEIADGVRVRAVRAMITDVLAKTEPARASADDYDDEDEDEIVEKPRRGARKTKAKAEPVAVAPVSPAIVPDAEPVTEDDTKPKA